MVIRVNGLTEGIQFHSKERFGGILNCNWCDYRCYRYCTAFRFHSRCERGLSISGTSGPYQRKTGADIWFLNDSFRKHELPCRENDWVY